MHLNEKKFINSNLTCLTKSMKLVLKVINDLIHVLSQLHFFFLILIARHIVGVVSHYTPYTFFYVYLIVFLTRANHHAKFNFQQPLFENSHMDGSASIIHECF